MSKPENPKCSEDPVSAFWERSRADATVLYLRGRTDGYCAGLNLAAEVVTLVCRRPDGTWDVEARVLAERHIEEWRTRTDRQVRHDVYQACGKPEKAALALAGKLPEEEPDA